MREASFLLECTGRRWNGTDWETCPVRLAVECTVSLSVNGAEQAPILASPVDPEELIVGWLITRGVIRDAEEITALTLDTDALPERLAACVEVEPREAGPEPERIPVPWTADAIQTLSDYVIRDARSHRSSHSTHSCTLMLEGEILCCREDISRHNTIDRAVGWAAQHGVPRERCIAFFSGRISSDLVGKAARAGIPVLCSKALPTAQAAALAREKGLVLLHCSASRGILQF